MSTEIYEFPKESQNNEQGPRGRQECQQKARQNQQLRGKGKDRKENKHPASMNEHAVVFQYFCQPKKTINLPRWPLVCTSPTTKLR